MEPVSLPPSPRLEAGRVPAYSALKERPGLLPLQVPTRRMAAPCPERSFSALFLLSLAVPSIITLALFFAGPIAAFPAVLLSFILLARIID